MITPHSWQPQVRRKRLHLPQNCELRGRKWQTSRLLGSVQKTQRSQLRPILPSRFKRCNRIIASFAPAWIRYKLKRILGRNTITHGVQSLENGFRSLRAWSRAVMPLAMHAARCALEPFRHWRCMQPEVYRAVPSLAIHSASYALLFRSGLLVRSGIVRFRRIECSSGADTNGDGASIE